MGEPPATSTAPAAHGDRRTALIVFGSLEIVFGCLSALLVPLVILGEVLSATAGAPPQWRQAMVGAGMYLLLAVALVWLGIGSIRRRRWARALSLVLGWGWLILGLVTVVTLALFLPTTANRLPSDAPPPLAFLVVALFLVGCPMVLVPAALVLFYSSRHVKATCEADDPVAGWTDACPLPVLAASLWMAFGAGMILLLMLGGQAAVPIFGTVLVGLPGVLASLSLALLWAYLARALYRLRAVGWWLTLGVFVVFGASSIATFARSDLTDLYRRMGYPEQQVEAVGRMPMITGPNVAIYLTVMFGAMIGYLLWIRAAFGRPGARGSHARV
jgi:hypothetical protein